MDNINIDGYEFLAEKIDNATLVFSTAKKGLNFNKYTDCGIKNLDNIKKWFGVNEVGYLDQVHSDSIFIYDGESHEGDSIITDKKNIAIGVFTADCVPILIYDRCNKIIAAVHSGWKGTLHCVVLKTIKELKEKYQTSTKDVVVFIGPHNRGCCYEVGEEVLGYFQNNDFYRNKEIFNNNKLNMENCIKFQLIECGVDEKSIYSSEICTFCNKKYQLHSYRLNKNKAGRMFSFIYLE